MNIILDKISERDVDFVIMRAFAESPDFCSLFFKKLGYSNGNVISIEHSYTDVELGESDITVVAMLENKKIGILIENKINAKAMRDQCLRYTQRGDNGKKAGLYDDFAVFLIAPQSYINSNEEAQKYANQISYEIILDFFESSNRVYDAEIIKSAIKIQALGYIVQEVPAITDFWKKLYAYCCTSNRQLKMYPVNGPKGPRALWPQFKIPLKGVELYYKSNQGKCDLQFNGKLNNNRQLKNELRDFVEENMHWADSGNSQSLYIEVPQIDFKNPYENHLDDINIVLDSIEKLTSLAIMLNDIGFQL